MAYCVEVWDIVFNNVKSIRQTSTRIIICIGIKHSSIYIIVKVLKKVKVSGTAISNVCFSVYCRCIVEAYYFLHDCFCQFLETNHLKLF